jgi:hypothetical protein
MYPKTMAGNELKVVPADIARMGLAIPGTLLLHRFYVNRSAWSWMDRVCGGPPDIGPRTDPARPKGKRLNRAMLEGSHKITSATLTTSSDSSGRARAAISGLAATAGRCRACQGFGAPVAGSMSVAPSGPAPWNRMIAPSAAALADAGFSGPRRAVQGCRRCRKSAIRMRLPGRYDSFHGGSQGGR